MFSSLGHYVYRFRWPVIAVWVAILTAGVVVLTQFSAHMQGGGFTTPDMASMRALQTVRTALPLSPASLTVVFNDPVLTVDDLAFRQAVEETAARLTEIREVRQVSSFYATGDERVVSADRHTTYLTVDLGTAEPASSAAVVKELRARLAAGPPRAVLTGDLAVDADIDQVTHDDLVRAETFALPLSLIVLLFVFGTAVAAGLPVTMGGIAVAATLAVLYLLARLTEVSVFSLNIVSMLGLGLGIDYSLLLVSRFREELEHDADIHRITVTTLATAGKTVFFSGTTVFIGLTGLLIYPLGLLRSLAYGGTIVVVFSVAAAITFVPAILAVLGRRVNALPVRRVRRVRSKGFWHHLADQVMKRPLLVFGATLVFMLALASPFLRARFGVPDVSALPAGAPSRQGDDLLKAAFGAGETSPILVVLQSSDPILSAPNVGAAYDLTQRLAADPRVKRVEGLFNLDPRLTREQYQLLYANPGLAPYPELGTAIRKLSGEHVTLLTVTAKEGPAADATKQLVKDLQRLSPGAGLSVGVTGATAVSLDIENKLFGDFPLAIGVVAGATFVALVILFRSVVLPIKALLMNGLSVVASYGVLVLIFQDGHLTNLLGFTSPGFIDSTAPLMLFCILFGLSMDYEVFLLTRIKEAYERTGSNTEGVAEGLEWTGGIISSAALIMVVVTGSFAATDLITVKSIGLGAAVAILLDATVVRALLVPATMRLLGDWNWWAPSFVRHSRPKPVLRAKLPVAPVVVRDSDDDG